MSTGRPALAHCQLGRFLFLPLLSSPLFDPDRFPKRFISTDLEADSEHRARFEELLQAVVTKRVLERIAFSKRPRSSRSTTALTLWLILIPFLFFS